MRLVGIQYEDSCHQRSCEEPPLSNDPLQLLLHSNIWPQTTVSSTSRGSGRATTIKERRAYRNRRATWSRNICKMDAFSKTALLRISTPNGQSNPMQPRVRPVYGCHSTGKSRCSRRVYFTNPPSIMGSKPWEKDEEDKLCQYLVCLLERFRKSTHGFEADDVKADLSAMLEDADIGPYYKLKFRAIVRSNRAQKFVAGRKSSLGLTAEWELFGEAYEQREERSDCGDSLNGRLYKRNGTFLGLMM
jgi:hypothetical protein